MIVINDNTVVVFDDTELADAVGCGNDYNYIYFGADIQLTAGITICPTKATLVIDGTYEGVTYVFTDMESVSATQTLGVRSASSIEITIRNMIINGRNYYGVPYVLESSATSAVSVIYENVDYTGRQITFNSFGHTRYIDCNINIVNITPSWLGQEVGEVNRVEIGGTTTITKSNQNDAIFYFKGDANTHYLRILEGADVTVSTAHYFMYAAGRTVPYTIEQDASFKLSTNTGISFSSGHIVSPFIIEENASFEYIQTSSSVAVYISGTLTVGENARFFMRADYPNATPLVYFTTSGSVLNLNLENPKSFVLYKMNTPNVNFASSRPFLLSGEQVNYWQNATPFPDAGTFDDIPSYQWHNPDWSNFEITGNAGSSMSNVSSTLIPPVEPPLSNLQLQNARVLSVGNLLLTVNPILDDGSPVTGTTDPHANIKIEYTDGGDTFILTGTADDNGDFSFATDAPVPLGTEVTVSANAPFLYKEITVTSVEAGELYIVSAPTHIRFRPVLIAQTPMMLGRTENEPIIVADTRYIRTDWQLRAYIDGPMHTQSGLSLQDAVVYVPYSGFYSDREVLSTITPVDIFYGTPDTPSPVSITWNDDSGILMNVTEPLSLNEEYSANIYWEVTPI